MKKDFLKTGTRAHIAVLLTNLFFGANFSFVKLTSPSWVGPYGLNIFRVGFSLILFWLLWLPARNLIRMKKEHLLRFLLCGLFGVAINQMLFIKGLTMTSTIHASLLILSTPLLITVFAFWMLKEKMAGLKTLGLLLGIGGAVLLVLAKKTEGVSSWAGDLLILLNALSYTFYFILVKPLMASYSPLVVVRWVFTFGFLMILPFGWQQAASVNWHSLDANGFLLLFCIVFCGTFLAYTLNVFGIKHLGASVAGYYIYAQPVFAATIAAFLLDERFTTDKFLAAVLIMSGVYLVSRKQSSAEK